MAAKGIVIGTADEARAWVAGAKKVSDGDRAALGRLVERFPTLTFFRETEEAIKRAEKEADIRFPAWFKAVRATLAGVHGEGSVKLWFYRFQRDGSPREGAAYGAPYTLLPPGDLEGARRHLLVETRAVLPIAMEARSGRSLLCIGLGASSEDEIYECREEDLQDDEAEGVDPGDSMYVKFRSYSGMLGCITSVEVDGKIVNELSAEERLRSPLRAS